MFPDEFNRSKNSFLDEFSRLDLYEEILWSLSPQYNIQYIKENTYIDKCKTFLNEVDSILRSGNQEQIICYFSDFSQIFKRSKQKQKKIPDNSISDNKRIIIIDQIIEKLISILVKCDLLSQMDLCQIIMLCLKKIFKIYQFFDKCESIESLIFFIIHFINDCPRQEVIYYFLIFLKSYFMHYYEQSSYIINEYILPKLIENDYLLFQYLPTKENEMQQKNPIISIYMIFVYHEIRKNPSFFSEKIQIIFDFLSNYIAKCQALLINEQMTESMDDFMYFDYESISILHNKKIENHISVSMQVYIIAISFLGGNFFDLYNYHKFPVDFLNFSQFSHDAKYTSLNFLHVCCLARIDLKNFLDKNIYSSLVDHLSNCTLRKKVIKIIDNLIKIDNSLIFGFIDADIEQTNIFIEYHFETENYNDVLNYMKLAQTVIHFYPSAPYKFDILLFIKNCIKILENGGTELPSIVFQIFIDMYDHLLKLGEPQLDLFNSQFLASCGIDIVTQYVEDESYDTETCEYASSFLSLFKSNFDR